MPDSLTHASNRHASNAAAVWMQRRYFSTISAITLCLTLWGFSDNLVWRVAQPSNTDPKFIFHGLFCLAWMLLFFVQSSLVRSGNVRLHRRLGTAGMLVAIGVTLSTLYVFVVVWKGWDAMPSYIQANRLLLPSFALFVLLGYVNRRKADHHRRYLLLATLYMLEPVLSRAFDPLDPLLKFFSDQVVDTSWWIFFVIVWNGLFLSLFAYDRIVAGKIHRVTAFGYAWFWAVWGVVPAV